MNFQKLDQETINKIISRFQSGYSFTEISRDVGVSRSSARKYVSYYTSNNSGNSSPQKGISDKTDNDKGERQLTCKSLDIRDPDQLLKYSNIDTNIWEVYQQDVKTWEVPISGKRSSTGSDQTYTMYYVSVKLRKREFSPQSIIEKLKEDMKEHAPLYPTFKKKKLSTKPHALEISIVDLHFGRLALKSQTGEDYNLDKAENIYLSAIKDLLDKSSGYSFDRVFFPIGQDFFDINDSSNQTPKHKNLLDVDGKLSEIFYRGCKSVIKAIDLCLERLKVPIEIIFVPGNHDMHTSLFLCHYLDAWYNNCNNVLVDTEDKTRKYRLYGKTLLGWMHESELKASNKPLMVPMDVPQWWAQSSHREIHTGHWHSFKDIKYQMASEEDGIRIRNLPSLASSNKWEYDHYIKSVKAAEAYIWSPNECYIGHFCSEWPKCKDI